jgi:SSS family solute:Na+ symporter
LLYSYNFYAPIILVPLVLGILGYIISRIGFCISAISGVIGVFIWNISFKQITQIDGLIVGVLVNCFSFFAFYIIQQRSRFVKTSPDNIL